MDRIKIVVVGAGVIGLAVACELSKKHKDILVIEKNPSFGQETSSRNSEVIHAGIYYPKDSLKANTCLLGKKLLYEYCQKNNIGYRKTGKLIAITNDNEREPLERLLKNGLENGVEDLKIISKEEIKKIEPNIGAQAAISSPSTGIIDSHSLMKSLLSEFKSRDGQVAYNAEVVGIDKISAGFKVSVEDIDGLLNFSSLIVVNASGLNSDKASEMVGIRKDECRIKYCKGDYFRVHNNKAKLISRLIYPLPKTEALGVHATLDLGQGLRLGPDDEYVDKIYYDIDESKKESFYENIKALLPFIKLEDLGSDTSGIRPKLQGPGQDFRDFVIEDESHNGFDGFINLIGIESPGLTASLAIAKEVEKIVKISL
ncbi:MAG: NAD(P)/FAD-dependent oxidoreductase [Candidatus Omnitrophica bacterium]|nr:NAD(P)/FAD-dependent oxidoreductase [Candidatus Omnitrophota bacterium]